MRVRVRVRVMGWWGCMNHLAKNNNLKVQPNCQRQHQHQRQHEPPSVNQGQAISLLTKHADGWCEVIRLIDGEKGVVPETYLETVAMQVHEGTYMK